MFEKQVNMVNHGAQSLFKLLSDYHDVENAAFKIKATEHDADEIAHQIMSKLNTTFVTPLDREDIHGLTSALDDILDCTEAAADRMALYEVKEPTESAIRLAGILAGASELTVKAVYGLRDMKNSPAIREACVAINRLENQGDQINRTALAVFRMHDQPMEALSGVRSTAISKPPSTSVRM